MFDNARNKIGNYSKKKVEMFIDKTLVFLERAYNVYDKFDSVISGSIDGLADKLFASHENFEVKEKKNEEELSKKDDVSVFDKLQPMMSDEEFKRIGLDKEETITGMQEFKKELMMDNFPQARDNNGPVRRLVPKRGMRSRGVFNIWTTILISVLFLGVFIVVVTLNH